MILRNLYHNDLAQASYLVGCAATGEALVVDPNRDIQQYIDLAEREGVRITAVTETHIHADYVSGSRELASVTGATLYLSKAGTDDWQYEFANESGATLITEGDSLRIGNIQVDVWHTPGHTPEHLSFLVTDTAGADQPMGIVTGDFVFVGDVGRPDLLEKAAGFTSTTTEDGARQLFQSIQRVKQLPDFVQVWPGHGAGSPCGKSLGAVPQTTIGYERLFNWAFTAKTEDEFVEAVLDEQPEPPVYFAQMKHVNKAGPVLTNELGRPAPGSLQRLETALEQGEPVVDVRSPETFGRGHIRGTINIPAGKGFVTWAGWLLPYDGPFHMIVDEEQVEALGQELRMIGLDNLNSYWTTDILNEWQASGKELHSIRQISVDELAQLGDYEVVDVRGASEYADGHIPGSNNIPLGYVRDHIPEIPEDRPAVFHCQTGRRSAIAASLASAEGRDDIYNLTGGFEAWEKAGKDVEQPREKASAAS